MRPEREGFREGFGEGFREGFGEPLSRATRVRARPVRADAPPSPKNYNHLGLVPLLRLGLDLGRPSMEIPPARRHDARGRA